MQFLPGGDACHGVVSRYGKRGFTILTVNVGYPRETLRSFMAGMKLSYQVFTDLETKVARGYEVVGVPKTFIRTEAE